MGKYRVTLEVELAGDGSPEGIRKTVEDNLTGFKSVRVRSVEGEFPDGKDDFNEWRYCLGPYAAARERMAR